MISFTDELDKEMLNGKKILLRVDFNVPVSNGRVAEEYRIKIQKKTIESLLNNGAAIGLVSHIAAINSFGPIANQIKEILGINFNFIGDCVGESVKTAINNAESGDVFLLENTRKYEGEKNNDPEFAKELAKPFALYINNAFSASHRNHASLVAVTNFLPFYAGPLLIEEIEHLTKALESSSEEKTLIIGGNKIDTKLPVIKNFAEKAEHILIGSAFAGKILEKSSRVIIPEDYIISNDAALDIGPKTIRRFTDIVNDSKIIIWNGPLGKVEEERFSHGSKEIARAIIGSKAFSIVGGGDTIAFLEKMAVIDKFNYVSTGGGAMLEFLAGHELPGLVALGYD